MLRRDYDEDLFKDSTMTFGEHLEELRVALFKSLMGLMVTFLVGLFIGKYVVAVIKDPLAKALTDYHERQSIQLVESKLNTTHSDEALEQFINRERMLVDEAYIDPQQLLTQLKTAYPHLAEALAAQLKVSSNPATQPGESAKFPADSEADTSPVEQVDASASPFAGLSRENMIHVFVWRPEETDSRVRLTTLSSQEGFSIYMKASILVGIVLAAPWIFWQIWLFVAAGLYPHEKRYVHIFLPFSLGLFLLGVCLVFFFVFQPVLDFLLSFNEWLGIDPDPRISEWLSFVLMLPLGFGIAFQLPLVMLFLERIGIFTIKGYLSYWRVSVLIIFVLAMILTPSDPYSMLLLALPLTFLFFGGIALCRLMPRNRSPFDEDRPRRRRAVRTT